MNDMVKVRVDIQDFLNMVVEWAAGKPDIQAVALVGSYARGAAKETSDIDLVLLIDHPENYLKDMRWIHRFASPVQQQVEDYGRLTSLRVWYQDGPEVEFGLTSPDWAADPLDAGTRQVILDGMVVLHEKKPLLSQVKI